MSVERSLRGAAAGAVAAAVWAAQQPLDKRAFGTDYDDIQLLGKAVTRGEEWPIVGFALHVQNGAVFGAAYAQLKPFLPGPAVGRAVALALAENFASWPLLAVAERRHPARGELPKVAGNRRALAQATWRHFLFGVVLGVLEDRLNAQPGEEPPEVPVSSNGHGDIGLAVGAPAAQDAV